MSNLDEHDCKLFKKKKRNKKKKTLCVSVVRIVLSTDVCQLVGTVVTLLVRVQYVFVS